MSDLRLTNETRPSRTTLWSSAIKIRIHSFFFPFIALFFPSFFFVGDFIWLSGWVWGTQLLSLCPSLVQLLVPVWRRFDRRAPSCLLIRCLRRSLHRRQNRRRYRAAPGKLRRH